MNDNTVSIDGLRVTQEEALQLMTHYLNMAARFYEATTADSEHIKTFLQNNMDDFTFEASVDFYNSLEYSYSRYDDGELQ